MNSIKAMFAPVLLLCVMSFSAGCGDAAGQVSGLPPGDGGPVNPALSAKNGFSEIEWATNTNLRLQSDNVAALFLEPVDAVNAPNTDRPDSGGNGYDLIPLVLQQAMTVTYSLDPANAANTIRSASLLDSAGSTVFQLNAQTPTVTKLLVAGNYDLRVDSGYSVQENHEDHRIVFFHCAEADSGKENPRDLIRLITERRCPYCDLTGVNLTLSRLRQAYLEGANFTGSNLAGSDLSEAYLRDAILIRTNLSIATQPIQKATDLSGARLGRANLTEADLTGANLSGAELSRANLFRAKLTNANLTGAKLSGATMPNGQTYNGPVPCPPGYVPTQL